jgi:Arc/MetJ-type ribon-helix-helix transcriptional regulator
MLTEMIETRVATGGSIELVGGVKKYSISLPEELAEQIRERVDPGGFSAYVTEALERRIARDKLREIVAEHERKHGPLVPAKVEAARAVLRHDKRTGL